MHVTHVQSYDSCLLFLARTQKKTGAVNIIHISTLYTLLLASMPGKGRSCKHDLRQQADKQRLHATS